jgi:hypothetical protein
MGQRDDDKVLSRIRTAAMQQNTFSHYFYNYKPQNIQFKSIRTILLQERTHQHLYCILSSRAAVKKY